MIPTIFIPKETFFEVLSIPGTLYVSKYPKPSSIIMLAILYLQLIFIEIN